MNKSKVVAIIQARMGSTRLPGKVLMHLSGKSVLEHVVERVSLSKYIDQVVVATTVEPEDDQIEEFCLEKGIAVIRGSSSDVLDRYYLAAQTYKANVIIRITSDCPFIDPEVIDEMIKIYTDGEYDLITNAGPDLSKRTFPRGLDTEVFSIDALNKAWDVARLAYHREHVTPYLYEGNFNVFYHINDVDYSEFRLTLDTAEDYTLISKLYERLYKNNHDFLMKDVIRVLKNEPSLKEINAQIEQKNY